MFAEKILKELESNIKDFSESKSKEVEYGVIDSKSAANELQTYGKGIVDCAILIKHNGIDLNEEILINTLNDEVKNLDLSFFRELKRKEIESSIDKLVTSDDISEINFLSILLEVSEIKYYKSFETASLWIDYKSNFLSFGEDNLNSKKFSLVSFVEATNKVFNSLEKEIFLMTTDELKLKYFNDPIDKSHELRTFLFLVFVSEKAKERNFKIKYNINKLRNPMYIQM